MPSDEQPKRIQLRRTKGWRKPEGAIVVSRPSVWGNPFHIDRYALDLSLRLYADMVRGFWNPSVFGPGCPGAFIDDTYARRVHWLSAIDGHPWDAARSSLGGHDLACWCRPEARCHADILLELANP